MRERGSSIPANCPHLEACRIADQAAFEGAELIDIYIDRVRESQAFAYTVEPTLMVDHNCPPEQIANIGRVKALSLARSLGEVGTSKYEEDGALLSLVTPTPGWEETQSYRGGKTPLLFHQEMLPREGLTTRESINKFVILSCVTDTKPPTPTATSPIERGLALLSEDDLEILRRPVFKLRPYDAMELTHTGIVEEAPEPILHPDGQVVADFADIETEDPEARAALERFLAAAQEVGVNVTLRPGETIIVDNHQAFHGRGVILKGHGERLLLRAHVI